MINISIYYATLRPLPLFSTSRVTDILAYQI